MSPLLDGESGLRGDAVAVSGTAIAIDGVCPPIAPRKHKGTVPDGPLSSGSQVRSLPGPLSAANLPGLLVTESAFASWTVHGQSHPRGRPATTPRSGKESLYATLRVARGGIEPSTPRFSVACSTN